MLKKLKGKHQRKRHVINCWSMFGTEFEMWNWNEIETTEMKRVEMLNKNIEEMCCDIDWIESVMKEDCWLIEVEWRRFESKRIEKQKCTTPFTEVL